MIPANQPYEARYKHVGNDHTHYTTKPVVAWDADRGAIVVDEKTGRLRPASSWSNFADVWPADPTVVAAIPGGGWLVEYKADDGELFSNPLVAWLVRADGSVAPVDAGCDGYADDPTSSSNFVRLYLPGDDPAAES